MKKKLPNKNDSLNFCIHMCRKSKLKITLKNPSKTGFSLFEERKMYRMSFFLPQVNSFEKRFRFRGNLGLNRFKIIFLIRSCT